MPSADGPCRSRDISARRVADCLGLYAAHFADLYSADDAAGKPPIFRGDGRRRPSMPCAGRAAERYFFLARRAAYGCRAPVSAQRGGMARRSFLPPYFFRHTQDFSRHYGLTIKSTADALLSLMMLLKYWLLHASQSEISDERQ